MTLTAIGTACWEPFVFSYGMGTESTAALVRILTAASHVEAVIAAKTLGLWIVNRRPQLAAA